jgi:hypothetical protein
MVPANSGFNAHERISPKLIWNLGACPQKFSSPVLGRLKMFTEFQQKGVPNY